MFNFAFIAFALVKYIQVLILVNNRFFSLLPFWKALESSVGKQCYEILWVMSFFYGSVFTHFSDSQRACLITWKYLFFTPGKFSWVIYWYISPFLFFIETYIIWKLELLAQFSYPRFTMFYDFFPFFHSIVWKFSLSSVSNPPSSFYFSYPTSVSKSFRGFLLCSFL